MQIQKNYNNIIGASWKILACLCFAAINTMVRYLTGGAGNITNPLSYDVVVFFQNLFAVLIILPFIAKDGLSVYKPNHISLHLTRIISAVVGIVCFYCALSKMQITYAVALQFTGPIFTVLGAKLYLQERITKLKLLGIILGFAGAVIITRPDQKLLGLQNEISLYIFLPLISAICFAIAKLTARELSVRGEKPKVLTSYLLIFMVPVSGIIAIFNWQLPSLEQLSALFILGILSSLAHYATAKAYVYAEVIFLMPFGFARLILTAILGFITFKEFPQNQFAWYGICLVLSSASVITIAERRVNNRVNA